MAPAGAPSPLTKARGYDDRGLHHFLSPFSLSLSFFQIYLFQIKKKINKKEIRRCTARICDGSNGRVVVYLKTLGISLTMLKPFFVCVCFLLLRKRTHDKSPCDCVDDDGTRCTPKTLDYGERERGKACGADLSYIR